MKTIDAQSTQSERGDAQRHDLCRRRRRERRKINLGINVVFFFSSCFLGSEKKTLRLDRFS